MTHGWCEDESRTRRAILDAVTATGYGVVMPPKSRGERITIAVRAPLDQGTVYQERADALGIHYGTYATMVLAQAHNLPLPDFVVEELEKAKQARNAAAEERRSAQLAGLDMLPEGSTPGYSPTPGEGEPPLARSA